MSPLTTKHEHFQTVDDLIPEWWRAGTFYRDEERDLCLVLPIGGWRDAEPAPLKIGENVIGSTHEIIFHPISHLYVYLYKGEWHMSSLEKRLNDNEDVKHYLNGCKVEQKT